MAKAKRQPKTELQKATDKLEKTLRQQYEAQQNIERGGDKIRVPEYMKLPDAAQAIMHYVKSEEQEVQTSIRLECHPHDGLICFYNAMERTFGSVVGRGGFSFFGGKIPPRSMSFAISHDQTVTVPIGEMEVPGMPIVFEVDADFDESNPIESTVNITFTYKRMYKPLIEKIEALARNELKTNSIFKYKAVDSNYEFIDLNVDTSKVVYSVDEQRQLDANIFTAIRNKEAVKASGVPIRRNILLEGPYGTGKTLTGINAAKLCMDHKWTFMTVLAGSDITDALEFAKRYQPCLVFIEDIDTEVGGGRDNNLNDILNTIDGLLSKTAEVITVLTTNRLEHINRAMLRPGRTSIIRLGHLDADTVERMVKTYSGETLQGKTNKKALWEAAEGYSPTYIAEAVHKAKLYALSNDATNGEVKITCENVVDALKELRHQFNLMNSSQTITEDPISVSMKKVVLSGVKQWAEDERKDRN